MSHLSPDAGLDPWGIDQLQCILMACSPVFGALDPGLKCTDTFISSAILYIVLEIPYEPRSEKTGLRGFRTGPT